MTFEASRDLPKAGFQLILDDIEQLLEDGEPVSSALDDLLSLGGRQPLQYGMRMLTPLQAAVYELAGDLPLHTGPALERPSKAGTRPWYIGVWSYGRIHLTDERPTDAECRLLGR